MTSQNQNYIILFALAVALIFGITQSIKVQCAEGDQYKGCIGDSVFEYKCLGGKWESHIVKACNLGEICKDGICMEKSCYGIEQQIICATPYRALIRNCINGEYQDTIVFCERDEYCEDGNGCVKSHDSCGNGVCELGETEINCYLDCGSLSNWDEYHANVPQDIRDKYTLCEGEFDCNEPEISQAISIMEERYNPKNPKEWIESASEWVFSMMVYDLAGGESQCHTDASELLKDALEKGHFIGNCIDASTVLVAMSRHKGIPAYHGGVCLSNVRSWKCQTYTFVGMQEREVPLGLGRIDGKLKGNVYGHAVSLVWNSQTQSFSVVDPTMAGIGLTKDCFGYSPVLETGIDGQVCHISNWMDLNFCRGF